MRYLRMATNAALGGALAAAFLAVLMLQLNPGVPLQPRPVLTLFAILLLFYGTPLALGFYSLIVVRQLLLRDPFSPGWLSLRLLAWISTGVAGVAAALMWLNLEGFQPALSDEAARRMAAGATAVSASAILLLLIAVVHYSFGRRGSGVGATLFVLTVAAAVALPLTARGRGAPQPLVPRALDVGPQLVAGTSSARLVLIALDGASLDYISTATAEGRLPHFGRILDGGAAMHLTTIRPTQPGPVWAAIATGKYPPRNGVASAASYRVAGTDVALALLPDLCFAHALVAVGLVEEQPHRSTMLRSRRLWDVLSGFRVSVGVVGWPLTDPVRPVLGYTVSDRLHLSARARPAVVEDDLVYPPEAVREARAALAAGDGIEGDRLRPVAALWDEDDGATSVETPPTERDRLYGRLAASLAAQYQPQFETVRLTGLDLAGHQFLRYAVPRAFGDVTEAERQRFGQVLDRHYEFVDAAVGEAMAALGADDLLLVVSGFGMEPVSLGKRLLARVLGEPDLSGSHEQSPHGFMLAYGGSVAAGRLAPGAIVDVTPTVLYFLGLPVARDMDGIAQTEVFKRTFTMDRPLTFIPSYDP